MKTMIEGADDEFVAVARKALTADADASAVLMALGWQDLLSDLKDDENRRAVFALFRAQGRELATTPALGFVLAQPYLEGAGAEPGRVVGTVARRSATRGLVHVAVGDVVGMRLLVDRPGLGVSVLEHDEVEVRRIDVPGRLVLHEIRVGDSQSRIVIAGDEADKARRRSQALGRIALALEMLGAAEGALALAVDHANTREQFGQPIGSYQAVRHLLAWAMTDCVALDSAVVAAVTLAEALPPRYDEIVKALAGRNSRRACERTLQVLGAVGFTAEHAHHHFHSRVLALDSLLGTSADLTHDLGMWGREAQLDLGLPGALLP